MAKRVCVIRVDGREIQGLYEDVIAVEICDSESEPSTFAIKFGVYLRPNRTWTLLDEGEEDTDLPVLRLWQRVTIEAGFEGNNEVLIDGYVAGIQPDFGVNQAESSLLVWGHDASLAMRQEEKIVSWENRKFSDVAAEIFTDYGLDFEVENSQVVHALKDNLLLQRGNDWDFLNRLAAQLGYEIFVRGAKAFFRKPVLSRTPQPDITVGLGPATTNSLWFKPKFVGDRPTSVRIARVNPIEKSVERVDIDLSPQEPLGEQGSGGIGAGRKAAGRPRTIAQPIAIGSEQEMESFAESLRRHHDWVIQAEGELDGMLYGRALRARTVVSIRGAGRQYSGNYHVTKVIHRFTLEEYRQRYWVERNASEDGGFGQLVTPVEVDQAGQIQAKGSLERAITRIAGREVLP
jgi:phage protein D